MKISQFIRNERLCVVRRMGVMDREVFRSRYIQITSQKSCLSLQLNIFTVPQIFTTSTNESIKVKISNNRDRCNKLAELQLSTIPQDFTRSVVQIRHSIRCLLVMYQASKYTKQQHQLDTIKNVGLALFYEIVNGINESVNLCQPSHELCAHALSTLGVLIIENQNEEGLRLLETAVNRSDLINMFSDLIVPSIAEPPYFLEMYKFIVDSYMRKCDAKILFVLLSKVSLLLHRMS